MTHLSQVENLLSHLRHFDNLPEVVQKAVAAAAVQRKFHAGQVIYIEGEPAETVYLLASGWVKATRITREGREQAMMFLQPVEVFGDIAVFTRHTYPGTVVALEDVVVWAIPAQTVLDLISRQAPSLAIREAAAEIAAQIPGVRGVVNRIEAPGAPSPARVIHLNLDQGRGISNNDKISE